MRTRSDGPLPAAFRGRSADTSAQFTSIAGSQTSERANNPAASGTWAVGLRAKIVSYDNFSDIFGFFQAAAQFQGVEFDNTGRLYVVKDDDGGYAEVDVWIDGYLGWFDAIWYTVGAFLQFESRRAGGPWIIGPLIPIPLVGGNPLVAIKMDVMFPVEFAAACNGVVRYAKLIVAKATETQATMRSEMSARPITAIPPADLTFYNPCFGPSFPTDQSGSGDGDFAVIGPAGTPIAVPDDPW